MILKEPLLTMQNLADEDTAILKLAAGLARKDPTHPERVRAALEAWRARH